LSTAIARCSSERRWSNSSASATVVSWLALSSTSQSCHSVSPSALEPAVHLDHVGLGDVEALGDRLDGLGAQIAFVDRLHLALELAQVEEQLLLRRGGAHFDQRPAMQDVFLDRGPDPPHRVGREPEAAVGVEALDRLHQPDVALRDDLVERQPVAAVAHRDLGDQAEVAGYELVGGLDVAMLLPLLGEDELLLGLQHREPPDLFEVAGKARARRRDGQKVRHVRSLSGGAGIRG
jgi:hypothetical protein